MINRLLEISENVVLNEPMSEHTSFRIGGNADAFANAKSAEEIKKLIAYCKKESIPYMIMGNGSNMLVSDKGIRGLVIQIGNGMQACEVNGEEVYAEAGVLMSKLSKIVLREELSGFETLSGIPGTLGGGIYMNAGAYGGEIKDITDEVTYIDTDGEIRTISGEEAKFSYRHSIFEEKGYIVLSAKLKLKKGSYDEIKAAMDDYNKRRADKQPLSMPSAGSTFKRPEGYFAGKLIQDCGLMGYSVGGAQVSEKHAGFIVNKGGAAAEDVLNLIKHVKNTVMEKFGVELEPEVRLLGEFDDEV